MSTIQSIYDISILDIIYKDSNVTIGTFPILFHKKNLISYVYPQEIVAGKLTDVYMTFNESTFNLNLTTTNFRCDIDGIQFKAEIFNFTTVKCANVTAASTKKLIINIYGDDSIFGTFLINENSYDMYSIGNDHIFKDSSNFLYSSNLNQFNFSFGLSVPVELVKSFECHFEDGTNFIAKLIAGNLYHCNLDSLSHQNMTIYFRTREGLKIKYSLNSIFLIFIRLGITNYNSLSKQIGNTLVKHQVILDAGFDIDPIVNRLFLQFNNSNIAATKFSSNNVKFDVYSDIPSVKNISLHMKEPNFYKVNGINGIFENKIQIKMIGTLLVNDRVQVAISTSMYVSEGSLKTDCNDLIVVYKSTSIGRVTNNCNSNETLVLFDIQESFNGNDGNYTIYLGNPDFNNPNTTVVGATNTNATLSSTAEGFSGILISNQTLQFVFVEKLNISSIDPQLALISQSPIQIFTNFQNHYENLVNYEIRLNGTGFQSEYKGFSIHRFYQIRHLHLTFQFMEY